jgi:hypothetical protein
MSNIDPVVSGPDTKYAGVYKLGAPPQTLMAHNLQSWRIIQAILDAYGSADFWDLSVAVRGHKHGTKSAKGPQGFVRYCIKSGWLQRV